MSDIDTPLCVAANSDTIYLASYKTDYNNNSGRPPSLYLYSSQQYPTSLSSIQWKHEAGSIINSELMMNQSLPFDGNGYWCAVDDTGTFVILSGAKRIETGLYPHDTSMTIQGLLYDKPSMLNNPTTGGLAVPTYDPVALNSTYPCVNRGECNGHLYVLPTTPGSPSNFGFVTYNNTSGFVFETLERTTMKFNAHVRSRFSPVNGIDSWDAFGYNNNRLVAVSTSANQSKTMYLDIQGQPVPEFPDDRFSANAMADCGTTERGFSTNVNNRSYFSCSLRSKPGEYAMFSVDINWISKMAEFPIKIDGMLMGIVPVPNQGGGAPTWALAYSDRLNGLYGVSLSGESSEGEEKIQERGLSGMIGGVVGGLVAVVLAIFAVFFWRNKRQQKKSNKTSVQDAPQYTEDKHPTLVDANCMKLPADYSEVKGNGHLPKIEETPLSPLLEKLLSQSQQLQFHSRPQAQPYTRPYPEIDPQQYPQSAPYLAQMYHAYPQPQMYQNFMQQHQPFSSTEYTASTTIPAPLPVSASVALASAPATIPTTVPAVAINSATAEAVQHEVQLSNHPRPKVFTTVSGTDPETVAAFSTAAGL